MKQEMLDFVGMVQRSLPDARFRDWVYDASGWYYDDEAGVGVDDWSLNAGAAIHFEHQLGRRPEIRVYDAAVCVIDGADWREQVKQAFLAIRHGGNLWLASETVNVADLIRDLRSCSDWQQVVGQATGEGACVCALGNGEGEHSTAVSVVVPTVQHADLPRFFVTHRSLQTGRAEYVVVSNGTERSDLGQMLTLRPDVFVHFSEPMGFPRACNVGSSLARATSEVLVLANDDTEMALHGWDSRLWEIADGERDLGAVAPVLSAIGNRWQIHGAVPVPDLYEAPVLFYAWVAFPRAVWEDVGGLNEVFGLGNCEDIDHSLRIRLSGRRLLVDPVTAIYHRVHGTFDLMTPAQFNAVLANAAAVLRATWGDKLTELAPEVDQWTRKMTEKSALSVDTSE